MLVTDGKIIPYDENLAICRPPATSSTTYPPRSSDRAYRTIPSCGVAERKPRVVAVGGRRVPPAGDGKDVAPLSLVMGWMVA
jgi:hypothetical protein